MRRLILVLLLVLVSNTPLPAQISTDGVPEVVGTYACAGMNPEGKPYSGTVEIVKHDRRFQVRWILNGGDVGGIGIVAGGRLSVAYVAGITREGIPVPAIVVFAVAKADPFTLQGEWAVPMVAGVFTETLVKLPKGHPVPAPVKPEKPPPDRTGEIKG